MLLKIGYIPFLSVYVLFFVIVVVVVLFLLLFFFFFFFCCFFLSLSLSLFVSTVQLRVGTISHVLKK